MNKRYSKYIYILTFIYLIWLIVIPFCFKLAVNPVLSLIEKNCGARISVVKPRLITSVIPHIKIKADAIRLLNKDDTKALEITKLNLNLRLLPLLIGKLHINSFETKRIFLDIAVTDKIFLGNYPIEINENNLKFSLNRFKARKIDISIRENNKDYGINGQKIYFKTNRKAFILNGLVECVSDKYKSQAKFDINLPKNKNLSKTKFNVNINNFNLAPFTDIISRFVCKEIENVEGSIDLNTNNNKLNSNLKNVKIIFKDKNKSMIFPNHLEVESSYKIYKNSLYIKNSYAKSNGIYASLSGNIKNIFSKTPIIDIKTKIVNTDIRKGALLLPPIVTEDISVPKLKEYPFYGNVSGDIRIKGKFPNPDIQGNIKVTDGILIKPIPNTSSGANINIDFVGQKLLLDVIVPAGGREVVYVTGNVALYGERNAHLHIRSSKSVNLSVAEFVVNPLHEILCFLIGPVPIMDIDGFGNIDIKVVGTKKDPHIWGDFNFRNTSARFLDINNLVLKNASGNLNFNDQRAHFVNKTGTLHGQPMTVDGICTLYGDIDFNAIAKNQKLNDLIIILTTSPMLKDMKNLVPPIDNIKGKADFNLNLTGKVLDVDDIVINKTIFPKGSIKLLNDSVKLNNLAINNLRGLIEFDKSDYKFNLESMISSGSKTLIKGVVKNGLADLSIFAPKINVNDLDPKIFKFIDRLYVKLNAKYKGNLNTINIKGINASVDVLKDNKPVKNGKIISGKITIKNSNLNVSDLKGFVKQNPFYFNLNVKNLGANTLNLEKAKYNGSFDCRGFDLTTINFIRDLKILPNNIQNELNKIEIIQGNTDVKAEVRNNQLNSIIDMDSIKFTYSIKEGPKKEIVSIPINMINGQIKIKNNVLYLHKLNCLIDNMPILLFGKVNNIYKNPKYNLQINSKLVQKVFDKYWNAHNIYPIKLNGDILYNSTVSGDKNNTHIKSNIRIEENSSIYYMGAVVGDALNPISVNLDADVNKDGRIKLHNFNYNKLIASQNNRQNVLPLLSMNGEIKKQGDIFAFKNLVIKTENPTNANFFNIIFKKPTIKQGNFTSDLKINGTSNRPRIIGTFDVNNMEMPYLNTTIKELSLNFKSDYIHLTTRGDVLSNYMMFNAKIKNNLVAPYRISGADLYINDFDINQSINQLKQLELKGLSSAIAPETDATSNELLNLILLENVKVRAGNVKIKNIKASNLEAMCSLDEKMRMSVDSFKFNMASGIITGKVNYNLLNNFMKMELNGKDVNANALSIALFDLPNQIFGSLTGHIELSCNATNDTTRMETLNGYGTFKVSNGRMPKLGSLEYLLKAGNLIKGGVTSLSMNGIIDIITPMKTGEFSEINGKLRIKDGMAKTIEINSHGKDLNLYITGRLNFITQVADMRVFGQISRKVSTVLGAAGNISLNTLFNKIPGVSLDSDSSFISDLNKIPGIELTNKASRKFIVEILGDINGEDFVKSFKWIN